MENHDRALVKCVYCLTEGELAPEQVLVRGEHLYLCAPRGPIVEGFLAIAPLRCIGCVAHFPSAYFDELDCFTDRVRAFYQRAYGRGDVTFYEQGRAAGSHADQPAFPLHAHLCALPLELGLHDLLRHRYEQRVLADARELRRFADVEPYLYVESDNCRAAYIGTCTPLREALKHSELRREVAVLAGYPERGHWRDCCDGDELNALLRRWKLYG